MLCTILSTQKEQIHACEKKIEAETPKVDAYRVYIIIIIQLFLFEGFKNAHGRRIFHEKMKNFSRTATENLRNLFFLQ